MKKIAFVLLLLCVVVSSTSLYARTWDHGLSMGMELIRERERERELRREWEREREREREREQAWQKMQAQATPRSVAHCYGCEYHRTLGTLVGICLLEQKKAANDIVKRQTSRVKILNAKFYKQYTTDTLPISMAKITVENKSDYPIKTIFFNGKLITHKTGQVLINDTFKYDVDGTFDAGQTSTYDIALNSYGKWAKANPPDLAKFNVVVTGIQTSDGRSFVNSFSDEDAKKLNDLLKDLKK